MLRDKSITEATAKYKPCKIIDGTVGSCMFQPRDETLRFKFRFEKKEQPLILGTYSEISLADAREKSGEARKLLRGAPIHAIRLRAQNCLAVRASTGFEALARERRDLRKLNRLYKLFAWRHLHYFAGP